MKKLTIEIVHKGEDYMGIKAQGEYFEVSLATGEVLKKLIALIFEIVKRSQR